ncbi:MAG: type II toxin-antitoxin system Phd/YefM family antitoxin [Deltaproteobacteria bacterium]|nr:MAG: type II toxin-antitoxin system Phd/YefM family antitoxin [Deltaproteobacteria bacterium]
MATTLSISEARAALPDLVDRVTNGEEITLTRHGRPVAIVVRPDALRVRRGERALTSAAELRERVRAARRVPRPVPKGVSRKRVDRLVADVRAGRARG